MVGLFESSAFNINGWSQSHVWFPKPLFFLPFLPYDKPSSAWLTENASFQCKHYADMCGPGLLLAQRCISPDLGAGQLLNINELNGKIQRKVTSQQMPQRRCQDGVINGSKLKG